VANYVTARFGSEPSNLTALMWPIFARKFRSSICPPFGAVDIEVRQGERRRPP